ncbi:MAG: lactate racemase domain-containing protein [Dehalococcoidia bacterium]|nr:lactate racemase domain-containing protein [Dehalococcoidia bacterium]
MRVKVPQLIFDGNTELELDFPSGWEVTFCAPPAYDRPEMSPGQMQQAFDRPVGSPRLREMAAGKREAVIIFDDITRPTPVGQIAPYVLGELDAAGMADEQIRFVVASGTHGAHDNHALRKKLGQEIVERYAVYNHNPYENCVEVGTTGLGTVLSINREVMACDLRIAIGGVLPHPQAGFGGGGKILLPGVSHIDSIDQFHRTIFGSPPNVVGMGNWDENPMRRETEDAVRLVGLDFLVNVLMNGHGAVMDLVAGAPLPAHHEGVRRAKEAYATVPATNVDIAVTNAYAKAGEAAIAIIAAVRSLKPQGGTIVMIMNCPEGQVVHYLLRQFGKEYGGRQYTPRGMLPPQFKLIILNPLPDLTCTDLFVDRRSVIWAKTWDEVMSRLRELHPDGAKVAVYPDGTAQYLRAPD